MSSAANGKTLVLMRHAKAEAGEGKPDHDRELAPRGRRDAAAAGRWLHEQGLLPDLAICSSAVRTRQTWEYARRGGAQSDAVEFRRGLYLGGSEGVLKTIREDAGRAADAARVIVIGHNPTMAIVTGLLSDGGGSPDAQARLADGFATSGLAVLTFNGDWADLDRGVCSLRRFHVSRG